MLTPSGTDGEFAALHLARSGADAPLVNIVIVALAIGLALLIQAFIVKPFRIPSASMVPTLQIGQRVLVKRAFAPR